MFEHVAGLCLFDLLIYGVVGALCGTAFGFWLGRQVYGP